MTEALEGRIILPQGDPVPAIAAMAGIIALLNAHGEDLTFHENVTLTDGIPLMEGVPADLWWARYVEGG